MSTPELRQDAPQMLLADIHRLFSSVYYRELKAEGVELTRAQWRVLALLRITDGRTQSELAEVMLMEKAPLGVLLDKLENKQLIERRPDPNDRRAKRIHITQTAQPLVPIMEQLSTSLYSEAAKDLSENELQEMTRMLTIMRDNLSNLRQQQN